jgi:hypothetical protein
VRIPLRTRSSRGAEPAGRAATSPMAWTTCAHAANSPRGRPSAMRQIARCRGEAVSRPNAPGCPCPASRGQREEAFTSRRPVASPPLIRACRYLAPALHSRRGVTHLAPCSTCARHVRVSEQACPFCGEELPATLRAAPPRQLPAARLKRAALCVLGAGTLTLSGCSSASYGAAPCPENPDCPAQDGAPDVTVGDAFMGPDVATSDAPVEAAPDAPVGSDAGGDDDGGAEGDAGEGSPSDGAPPAVDGGNDAQAD